MNFVADIGNNSAKLFLFKDEQMLLHTRKSDGNFDILEEWAKEFTVKRIIISSVIEMNEEQINMFKVFGCPIVWFNNSTPCPLKIKYGTPGTLGPDRIAAAVGAWGEAPGRNILVIDAGSAITYDIVDNKGNFLGGNIAPGIKMRLRSLHEFTDRLPMVVKDGDIPFIGYDTETAIRSGVITGICHEIEGYIRAAREKFGEVFVFLTGGDGISLKNNIKSSIFADKFLVAKGLNRILLKYDNI